MTSVDAPTGTTLAVSHEADVGVAGRTTRDLALEIGFSETEAEELCLVARELASNLLRHAGGGAIRLSELGDDPRGIEIVAIDRGPGIPDVEAAFADGFSTAGSLGGGLGAVNRLTDALDIACPGDDGVGTRVTCRRWRRALHLHTEPSPLDIGVCSRPHPSSRVNGDAFVCRTVGSYVTVGVIDGVGHGRAAHRAASTARQYVENHADRPIGDIFRGVGRTCRATRGVVMALAQIRWLEGRMHFASVGNVEVRIHRGGQSRRFVVRRGILGYNAPNSVVTEHPWSHGEILVLHSDGVSPGWHWDDFPGLWAQPAAVAARTLHQKLAKATDDATVLVVRGRSAEPLAAVFSAGDAP